MSLGDGDPVQNGIEMAIAPAVQTMANQGSRGSLEGCYASVGSQLSFGGETTSWAKDASQSPSRQKIGPADLGQGMETRLSVEVDLSGELLDLIHG